MKRLFVTLAFLAFAWRIQNSFVYLQQIQS